MTAHVNPGEQRSSALDVVGRLRCGRARLRSEQPDAQSTGAEFGWHSVAHAGDSSPRSHSERTARRNV